MVFFLAPMGSDGPDFVTLYLFFTNKYEKKTIIIFFKKKTCFVHNKGFTQQRITNPWSRRSVGWGWPYLILQKYSENKKKKIQKIEHEELSIIHEIIFSKLNKTYCSHTNMVLRSLWRNVYFPHTFVTISSRKNAQMN